MKALIVCASIILGLPVVAQPQTPRTDTPVTDGSVRAIREDGGTVYLAGSFSYVGLQTGSAALVAPTTGAVNLSLPVLDGDVHAAISDGAGGWYLGGNFTVAGGISRAGLVRIDSAFAVVTAFQADVQGTVRALFLDGADLFVGGSFTMIGGQARQNIARVDASTGAVAAFSPQPDSTVNAISAAGGTVYFGGDFQNVNATERRYLAAAQTTGALLAWNPRTSSPVEGIHATATRVYFCGSFLSIGGGTSGHPVMNRTGFAIVDATTGASAPELREIGVTSSINAMGVDGTRVYLAGNINGVRFNNDNVGILDSQGVPKATPDDVNNDVLVSIPDGAGGFYIGGLFTSVGGVARAGLARIDAAGGLVAGFAPDLSTFGFTSVKAMVLDSGSLYIGGTYTGVGRVVKLDATTGVVDTGWEVTLHNGGSGLSVVNALHLVGTELLVGGAFSQMTTTATGSVPRDGAGSVVLATQVITSTLAGLNGSGVVRAFASDSARIYVAGQFIQINGAFRNHLAAVTIGAGAVASWNPNPNNAVNALATDGTLLVAGGTFTAMGATQRTRVASFDTATLTLQSLNAAANNEVQSLALDGGWIYLGGRFTTVTTEDRRCLARVDAQTGAVDAWDPVGGANDLFTITIVGGVTFVGGDINYLEVARSGGAAFDLSTQELLPFSPVIDNGVVNALGVQGPNIYVAGTFKSINGSPRLRLAALDATGALHPMQCALGGTAFAVHAGATQLLVGGDFASAGGAQRENLAAFDRATRLVTPWAPADAPSAFDMVVDATTVYVAGNRGRAYDRATAAPTAWEPSPSSNILAIEKVGNTIYLGGTFTHLTRFTRSRFAVLDPATAVVNTDFESVVGNARTATSDGAGGWYVGGDGYLTHFLSTGAVDPAFNVDVGGTSDINSIALAGGKLYFGGNFTEISGQPRSRIAAVDPVTGAVDPWNPGASGTVQRLRAYGGRLYVVGSYSTIAGQTRHSVASFDLATGNITSWAPNPDGTTLGIAYDGTWLYLAGSFANVGGVPTGRICQISPNSNTPSSWTMDNPDGLVRQLVAAGGMVYAGGHFTMVGSQTRTRVAAYNTTSQTLTGWAPTVDGPIYSMTALGSTIYLGGQFTQVQGQPRAGAAALDGVTAALTGWDPAPAANVWDLAQDGSFVAMAGDFNGGLGGMPRNRVAATDLSGAILPWAPDVNGTVYALAASGSKIYLGGTFNQVNGQPRNSVAAVHPASGALDPFDPNVVGGVRTLALDGPDLHIGGTFTSVGGASRSCLATVDAQSGALGSMNTGFASTIYKVVADQGLLYVGGDFDSFGTSSAGMVITNSGSGGLLSGLPEIGERIQTAIADGAGGFFIVENRPLAPLAERYRIRRIHSSGSYDPNFLVAADGAINALVLQGTKLFAGGDFVTIGGQSRLRLARIDADAIAVTYGDVESTTFTSNGPVYAMASDGTALYVGGTFSSLSGSTRRSFGGFTLPGLGISVVAGASQLLNSTATVRAIHISGGKIYVGGSITSVAGSARSNLAAWDITAAGWSSWAPQVNGAVHSIWVDGLTAFVGGEFTQVGGQPRAYLAAINADPVSAQFGQPLGWAPTVDGHVLSVRVSGTDVLIAGSFENVNTVLFGGAAVLDSATAMLTPWRQTFSATCRVMLPASGDYVVAGDFELTGLTKVDGLTSVQAVTGMVSSWRPVVNGVVQTILSAGPSVYAGGSFGSIGGVPAADLAEFNTMPQISTPLQLADVFEGLSYSGQFITASGGTAPYTWSIANGPPWLSINSATGELTGNVPLIAPATATFDITVTDSGSDTDVKQFSFNVIAVPPVTVIAAPLADQYEGQAVTGLSVAAQGGATPYQWSLQNAPLWLSIDANTGQLMGTIPGTIGPTTVNFTAVVTDRALQVDTQAFSFVVLAYNAPQISTSSLPNGFPGIAYDGVFLQSTGGAAPYVWSISGAPSWLSIDPATGELAGSVPQVTPPATVNFSVTVTDFFSNFDTQPLSISIVGIPTPVVVTTTLPGATIGTPWQSMLSATGGTPPYTWSLPSAPSWIQVNPATGQLSGTPPVGGMGVFVVDVAVTDLFPQPQVGAASLTLSIQDAVYSGGADIWESKPNLNSGFGAPAPVGGAGGVSLGTRFFVWGGSVSPSTNTNVGGIYDPGSDTWVSTPNLSSGIGAPPAANGPHVVWTGRYVIVWGGFDGGYSKRGGIYEPATDTWLSKPNLAAGTGAPAGRVSAIAVWTGSRLLVWGGAVNGAQFNNGGLYDPESDTWESKPNLNSATGAPEARYYGTGVWTGSQFIVWGGQDGDLVRFGGGGVYTPATDTWSIPPGLQSGAPGAPTPRSFHTGAWTGSRLIIWGGAGSATFDDGGIYDPATDSWAASPGINGPGRPTPRYGFWSAYGSGLLTVWGGAVGGPTPAPWSEDGGVYDAVADAWKNTPNLSNGVNSPLGRNGAAVGWVNDRFIAFGGSRSSVRMNDGGCYAPPLGSTPPAPPVVTIQATDMQAAEFAAGTQTGTFTISLAPTPTAPVTIRYVMSGTAESTSVADYHLTGPGVTFSPSTRTIVVQGGISTAVVTLEPVDDIITEPTESATMTIEADSAYVVGTPNAATIQIADNDSATIPDVAVVAGAGIHENTPGTTFFEVGLSNQQPGNVTVNFEISGTAEPGVDYDMPSVSLTRAGSVWQGSLVILSNSATRLLPITPIDDAAVEGSESIIITLVAGTGYNVLGGGAGTATVQIVDDETPPPQATVVAGANVDENAAGTSEFEVALSGQATTDVTIQFEVSGTAVPGVDYDVAGVVLTRAGLVWTGSVVVQASSSSSLLVVTAIDDSAVEGDETIVVTLTPGPGYLLGSPAAAQLTIHDDESPSGGGDDDDDGDDEGDGCSTGTGNGSRLILVALAAALLLCLRPRRQLQF